MACMDSVESYVELNDNALGSPRMDQSRVTTLFDRLTGRDKITMWMSIMEKKDGNYGTSRLRSTS